MFANIALKLAKRREHPPRKIGPDPLHLEFPTVAGPTGVVTQQHCSMFVLTHHARCVIRVERVSTPPKWLAVDHRRADLGAQHPNHVIAACQHAQDLLQRHEHDRHNEPSRRVPA